MTALFLLLPTLMSQMENTRQFYYFKTSQIIQWLGEELPALMFFVCLVVCFAISEVAIIFY